MTAPVLLDLNGKAAATIAAAARGYREVLSSSRSCATFVTMIWIIIEFPFSL